MRRIAHISDLHFGRIDPAVVAALRDDLAAQAPDLIVVSGDLTQRARPSQFRAARAFLADLPAPHMVVPGNHDLPAFNLLARLVDPLRNYRRYIAEDLDPFLNLGNLAVLGLNTSRSLILDFAEGRVNQRQMDRILGCLRELGPEVFKVVFTHHPFLPPPDHPGRRLVGRATRALRALEAAGVDLLLAGHLHRAYSGDVMSHHAHVERSILVAQASTATSTRLRNEPNAWNLIEIAPPSLVLRLRTWEGERFMPGLVTAWEKHGPRWEKRGEDTGLAELDRRLAARR
ncbi:metallophosphoesterase family protein [Rhodospirillum centenum]|uniref:3',5'-cyclic-nucleotide phosphodiesterase, putative n=1 Tax=Rhodospirillum centenum (strain ATCC 51521 / SW) TaxID=414684 RepID=B6IMU0_RHOCS|nr:metallophosphoesterase [Rhodospirillum centenum]ACI98756.1 3',5'-cyclic-nucleotide phosphodiesterase, putative [Rhodospirillum centenum SW]